MRDSFRNTTLVQEALLYQFIYLVIAGLHLSTAGIGTIEYMYLGFPDGYLTRFERVTSDVRLGAILVNITFGIMFIALGIKNTNQRNVASAFLLGAVSVFCVVLPSVLLTYCPEVGGCALIYEAVTGSPIEEGAAY